MSRASALSPMREPLRANMAAPAVAPVASGGFLLVKDGLEVLNDGSMMVNDGWRFAG